MNDFGLTTMAIESSAEENIRADDADRDKSMAVKGEYRCNLEEQPRTVF